MCFFISYICVVCDLGIQILLSELMQMTSGWPILTSPRPKPPSPTLTTPHKVLRRRPQIYFCFCSLLHGWILTALRPVQPTHTIGMRRKSALHILIVEKIHQLLACSRWPHVGSYSYSRCHVFFVRRFQHHQFLRAGLEALSAETAAFFASPTAC